MQEEDAAKEEEEEENEQEEERERDTTPNEWLRQWGSHVSLFLRQAEMGEDLRD